MKKTLPKPIIFALGIVAGGSGSQALRNTLVPPEDNRGGGHIRFDYDEDGDVDGLDFSHFVTCYNKANNLSRCFNGYDLTKNGKRSDIDNDRDVDLVDFLAFANCYNGAEQKPRDCGDNIIFITGRITK